MLWNNNSCMMIMKKESWQINLKFVGVAVVCYHYHPWCVVSKFSDNNKVLWVHTMKTKLLSESWDMPAAPWPLLAASHGIVFPPKLGLVFRPASFSFHSVIRLRSHRTCSTEGKIKNQLLRLCVFIVSSFLSWFVSSSAVLSPCCRDLQAVIPWFYAETRCAVCFKKHW